MYVVFTFFDDTKKPVAIVSDEIMQEANYHRFHYNFAAKPGSGAFMQAFITDTDTQIPPQPLGLTFKLKTEGGTGSGNFNLNLRHFANNVPKNGDPQGGEQDILADFPVKISK